MTTAPIRVRCWHPGLSTAINKRCLAALAARAEARPGSSRRVEELLTAACLALIAALVAEIAASS